MDRLVLGYDRKFGDGNFGSEGFSLSLDFEIDPAQVTTEYALDRAAWIRRVVLSFLAASKAERVRHMARHELQEQAAAEISESLERLPFDDDDEDDPR